MSGNPVRRDVLLFPLSLTWPLAKLLYMMVVYMMKQWWLFYRRIYASLGLNELKGKRKSIYYYQNDIQLRTARKIFSSRCNYAIRWYLHRPCGKHLDTTTYRWWIIDFTPTKLNINQSTIDYYHENLPNAIHANVSIFVPWIIKSSVWLSRKFHLLTEFLRNHTDS